MRFLIVDDSKAMRNIVMRSLRQAGYGDHAMDEAINGERALFAVRTSPPDLIFCDINMPEMGGLELLKSMREEGIGVRLGFITSECTQEMISSAIAAGAEFVLTKPFTPAGLKSALSKVLP